MSTECDAQLDRRRTVPVLAITAAIFLLSLTGLVAGSLAHTIWGQHDAREYLVWPVALFAFIAMSLACCALTRSRVLGGVFVLVACGAFAGLFLLWAVAQGS